MNRTWAEAAKELERLANELERLIREDASTEAFHEAFMRGIAETGRKMPLGDDEGGRNRLAQGEDAGGYLLAKDAPGGPAMTTKIGNALVTCREPDAKCELCGKVEELRPYGQGGKRVCFTCGMKDREGTARRFARFAGFEKGGRR